MRGLIILVSILLALSHVSAELPVLAVLEYERSARKDAGFAAALIEPIIASRFTVDFVDIASEFEHRPAANAAQLATARLAHAAIVLVKSDWNWIPDRFARRYLKPSSARHPLILSVAGSHPPPWLDPDWDAEQERDGDADTPRDEHVGERARGFYSLIFYETPFYQPFVRAHQCAARAFGIATAELDAGLTAARVRTDSLARVVLKASRVTRMHQTLENATHERERDIDVLFVGKFHESKRPLTLLDEVGGAAVSSGAEAGGAEAARPWRRVVAVGDHLPHAHWPEGPEIVRALRAGGVEVINEPMPLATLARDYYSRAQAVLVPCDILGGGERAVLEARCVSESLSAHAPCIFQTSSDFTCFSSICTSCANEVLWSAARRGDG